MILEYVDVVRDRIMDGNVNISIALVDDLKLHMRREHELLGVCPVCGCDDANFNTLKLKWRCWHCPGKGIIIPEEGYVVQEVEEKVLDLLKVRALYSSLASKYHDDLTPAAISYLQDRGLTQKTIDEFQLGFCSTRFYDEYSDSVAEDAGVVNQNYPALTNRITIPYIANGEITDLRGRTLDSITYKPNTPTYMSLSGNHSARGATFLFNHDVIEKGNRILITEGEFKAIVAHQHGFDIVATPGIFGWQKDWSSLFKGKEVILVADFDRISGLRSPAYLMAKSLLREIPQLKVALLSLAKHTSDGKVDVDSLIAGGNLKMFNMIIEASMDAPRWLASEEKKGHGRQR